ncbi:MAG: RidA family protein [Proteobacteria bacterium]|mgnify:CR=1 FL=1|nr:RidA family protein [Pseudomonadota bacterium]NQW44098.1 RidA family protein [Deltaproteobacteria bacterium]
MNKEIVATNEAPQAIGPYSQAVKAGGFLFISGQIPLDPKTGAVVGNTIELQTEQVMKNLIAILACQKLGLEHVVKTTVFITQMSEFPRFNEVYATFIKAPYPARATVEVSKLPKGVFVEIEAIAVLA